MPLFRRAPPPEALSAAMAGVKMGDRLLFAGGDDLRLVLELASRSGLSGRVVLLAPSADVAKSRASRAEQEGALVEPAHAPLTMLPFDSASFDVAVAEETLMALGAADRRGALSELLRVVRPGGRLLWIEKQPRGGLFRLASAERTAIDSPALEQMLRDAGFRGVRTFAAVQGRTYVEGTKAAAGN